MPIDEEIQRRRDELTRLEEKVRAQEKRMEGWRLSGVDPEVNTDYRPSDEQWDWEGRQLEKLERSLAAARAELARLLASRGEDGEA